MANASRALDEVKGGVVDLWYSDPKNSLRQNISVEYDTRFTVGFQSLNGGQQVCSIPPGAGIRDVLLVLEFSAAQLATIAAPVAPNTTNGSFALPQGWGYNSIATVTWRIGGSSEYSMSGSQLLARNLRQVKTQTQKTAILTLGGNQVSSIAAGDYGKNQYAYIPLSFWKSASVDGFEPVIASDLLGQQIQIRVTFNSPSSVFYATGGGVAPPSSFNLGYFQVQQLNMYNKGQSLAVQQDMSDNTYVAPLRGHDQQELTAQIGSGWSPRQAVTVSGIMSGQVRTVQVYLTDNAAPQNAAVFTAPAEVTLQYAGVNYAQYNDGTAAVWNLLDSSAPSSVPANSLSFAGSTLTTTSVASTWAVLPFSQPTNADFEATILVAGKPVTNGSITLFITSPDTTKNWTLHVIPTLNSAVAYSRGSANILIG